MAGESGSNVKQDALLGVLLFATVLILLITYQNFHFFANIWRWIRFGELYLFQFLPSFYLPLIGTIDFGKAVSFLSVISPYGLDLSVITKFDNRYAPWIGVPLGLILILRAKKIGFGDKDMGKVENMESIFERFTHIYPHLKEIYDVNPQTKPLRFDRRSKESYRWGKAISGYQFATLSPPLGLEREAKKNGSYKRPIYAGQDDFDMDLAERTFEAQLGSRWEGEEKLSEAESIAFTFLKDHLPTDSERTFDFVQKCWRFTLKLVQKRGIPDRIKSKTLTEKEIDLVHSMIDYYRPYFEALELEETGKDLAKILKKKGLKAKTKADVLRYLKAGERFTEIGENKKGHFTAAFENIIADQVMGGHNYVRAGLMSLNQAACDGGRISLEPIKSAIKSRDRTLWLALKCAGRQVAWPECSGVHAHWLFEKDKGRRISYPCVQEAVEALRLELRVDVDED